MKESPRDGKINKRNKNMKDKLHYPEKGKSVTGIYMTSKCLT